MDTKDTFDQQEKPADLGHLQPKGLLRKDKDALLSAIVDSSDDAILSKTLDGIITSWNRGAEKIYGYRASEVIGRSISILVPPELPNEIPAILNRLKNGERIEHYETIRRRKDGSLIDISLTVSPVLGPSGDVIGASAVARDITARKLAEKEKEALFEKLNIALNEKNILLHEVHHRVKNNLQVISSLLDLRSRYIKDPEQRSAFRESVGRVRAMSLIHEKLYQTERLGRVDFVAYIQSLVPQLVQSYALDKQIELVISGEACILPLNQVLPLGLIFNELVTNSLKYAFHSLRGGKISVDVKLDSEAIRINLSDNGPGLPDEFDFATVESFGFRIVKLLIGQIKGTIEVRPGNGTCFEITIPSTEAMEE